MKSFTEIKSILNEHSSELLERYRITNLVVFGSIVRGEAWEGSDVDILADVPENMSLLGIISVENYLSDLLGMKVDLNP